MLKRSVLMLLGLSTPLLLACGPGSDAAEASAAAGARSGTAGQAGPFSLTLENILREAPDGVGGTALSPDGGRLAVTAEGPEGRGIYLLVLEGPAAGVPPAVAAAGPGADAASGTAGSGAGGAVGALPPLRFWGEGGSPAWSPDGDRVAFLRGGELWVRPVEGGEEVRLVTGLAGVRDPVFSPQGDRVAFYASESGSQDIWVVDAGGSEEPRQLTRELMTESDTRFVPAWSPDGATIVSVGNRDDYMADDLWAVDVASGEMRQLTDGLQAIGEVAAWSPSGDRIAVLAVQEEEYWFLDLADIYLVDPGSGRAEKLGVDGAFATAYRHRPWWSEDGSTLYFAYQERGEHHLWSVPAEGGVATRVTQVGGAQRGLSASAGADRFAFVRSTPTEGPDAWVVDAAGGPARRVTDLAPAWEGLRPPLEVAYRSWDGLYIQGFLYLPEEAAAGETCPALVQVHGGGTNSYMAGRNLTEQYLASRGYVVLAINYRGGSGFGRGFQELGREDWLNGQARDPGAAADYLRGLPWVNGSVGIYGYSYGGMQAMAAITRTPDAFDAAVPMAGIYSEARTYEDMDRLGQVFAVDGHGGLPSERPEIYEKTETLDRMDRITVPLLMMHGTEDVRAPYSNFLLARERLEELGKEFETATFPEGHGFRDPENRISLYRNLEDFFGRQLPGCSAGG